MESSAQIFIRTSNIPSHKKLAELNSFLFWQAWNLHIFPEVLRSVMTRPLWVTWVVFIPYPFAPNSHLLPPNTQTRRTTLSPSPSFVLPTPLLKSLWFLRDLTLESVRKLKKILLLCSRALGEALATWCVCYSWSLAPRRLDVASIAHNPLWLSIGKFVLPLISSGTLQSTALVVGWWGHRQDGLEDDSN